MKEGNLVYCHTNGFMKDDGEQFCTAGRYYATVSVDKSLYPRWRNMFAIIDDRNKVHTFSLNGEWFTPQFTIIKHSIPKLYLYD